MFFYIWLRSTLPRFRYDRLMAFGWKVLLPVATLNLVVTAVVVAFGDRTSCSQETLQRRRDARGSVRSRSSYMFEKKPTIQYPSVKKQHAPRFHGLHELRRYDDGKERCIGCELCSSVCPANAITVIGAENSPEDRRSPGERYAARYEIDELRCIFCGMCEEACPTDAIVLTPRFEMADYRRGSFIYAKDRLLVPPEAGVGDRARRASRRHPVRSGTRRRDQIDRSTWHDGYGATYRGRDPQDARKARHERIWGAE